MDQKKKVLSFIKKHEICVLSTADLNGKPEAAVIEFDVTVNLKLIFNTFTTYRKYPNIKTNPHVAVVIGWDNATVQYDGFAAELEGTELEQHKNSFLKKHPHAVKFAVMPETRFFKITPNWIRLRDLTTKPETVIELVEF
jgi:general stress protein 26